MKYTIAQNNDINHGLLLTVRIPQEEVDWNALHTLESDLPGFVVPFHYHKVDDAVEMTFQPGKRRMLRYFGGEKKTEDYAQMFVKLLSPLQVCKDWFLQPLCFLLDFNWVFIDSSDDSISYLYLPVKEQYMTMDDIVQMIRLTNNNVQVNNPALENKVLHAVTDDYFTIPEFLKIFHDVSTEQTKPVETIAPPVTLPEPVISEKVPEEPEIPQKNEEPMPRGIGKWKAKPSAAEKKNKEPQPEIRIELDDDDELYIGGLESVPSNQENKSEGFFKKIFSGSEEKKQEKLEKKERQKELQLQKQQEKEREKENRRRKKEEKKNAKTGHRAVIGGATEQDEFEPYQSNDDLAHLFNSKSSQTMVDIKNSGVLSGTRLEYIGRGNHEPVILINMDKSDMFKIGRFDNVLNKKQSDFEFPADTKEVSRRHAVIERMDNAYYLVDIGSMAGTYVNGHRLGLNEQFLLQDGDMVSFGKAGADYAFIQEN